MLATAHVRAMPTDAIFVPHNSTSGACISASTILASHSGRKPKLSQERSPTKSKNDFW